MRGTAIGRRVPNSSFVFTNPATKHSPFLSPSSFSSSFSTSSGRGRGRGGPDPAFSEFVSGIPGKADSNETKQPDSTESPRVGFGHGRGKPVASDPILPAFSSFISSIKPAQNGAGRGRGGPESTFSVPKPEPHPEPAPGSPTPAPRIPVESILPDGLSVLPGAGRGKTVKPDVARAPAPRTNEENRHVRPRPKPAEQPKMSQEEAVKKAMSLLASKEDGPSARVGGGGGRGREGRGRGRGRGEPRRQWERRRGRVRGVEEDSEEMPAKPWEVGSADKADAEKEKFAQKFGVEVMTAVEEGLEDMASRVLPSPEEDEFIEALHTNCMIEFEPEYLMGEFNQNPDIDEKPPIPLRDFLEKVKPFMMAYQGIQSHEEWEEAVEETMKNAPLLKEIVDDYCGPDRITAKKQQEELDKVAKTIPASSPASLKHFTDRALLSLQSNPGWKYNKKYQFMDKLVREVQQFK